MNTQNMINDYMEGLKIKEIAIKYNVCECTVRNRFKRVGFKPSNRSKDKTLNVDYFQNIDTPNKAYVLGFIMADGCIMKTSKQQKKDNRLYIGISEKDKNILEFIKEELNSQCDIVQYVNKNSYSSNPKVKLYINSQKVCHDLKNLGVTRNKTGKECIPPQIINSEFLFDFLKGFFDGDGSVVNSYKKWSYFSFCSCFEMINQISVELKKVGFTGALTPHKDKRHDDVYGLQITTKHDVLLLYRLFYENSKSYSLKRKMDKVILPE